MSQKISAIVELRENREEEHVRMTKHLRGLATDYLAEVGCKQFFRVKWVNMIALDLKTKIPHNLFLWLPWEYFKYTKRGIASYFLIFFFAKKRKWTWDIRGTRIEDAIMPPYFFQKELGHCFCWISNFRVGPMQVFLLAFGRDCYQTLVLIFLNS